MIINLEIIPSLMLVYIAKRFLFMLKLLSCFLFFLLCIGGLTVSASSRPSFIVETPFIDHDINVLKRYSSISFLVKKRNQALDKILLQSNHPELIPDGFISLDKSVVEVELDIPEFRSEVKLLKI
ncbi:MAG: hypothetical protein ACKO3R_04730 [bacterium]